MQDSVNGSKGKILIVEDEFIVAINMKMILEKNGYEIAGHARTGQTAIKMTKEKSPDLIIMDINLGDGMDGIESAVEILKSASIPIIFSTGNSDNGTFERANSICQDGYLVKPFQGEQLISIVEAALIKD